MAQRSIGSIFQQFRCYGFSNLASSQEQHCRISCGIFLSRSALSEQSSVTLQNNNAPPKDGDIGSILRRGGDWLRRSLKWGRQTKWMFARFASFHFCFPLRLRTSSPRRSKQKCPALGAGTSILFAEREGFEPNLQYDLFSMCCARWLAGTPNFPPRDLATI